MSDEGVNIKVAVRCRPMNSFEKKRNAGQVVVCDQERKTIKVNFTTGKKADKKVVVDKSYQFDKVFGQYSTQAEVFTTMVEPVVDEVIQGFNCTVFAYGQTGTGKTHTMEGDLDDPTDRGVIARSVHHIFDYFEKNKSDFTVRCSYLEIYNEQLADLLDDAAHSDAASASSSSSSSSTSSSMSSSSTSSSGSAGGGSNKTLMLCEGTKGVVCNNLTETAVTSVEEVFACLRKGIAARQVAETLMNKTSSRSHSIFTLKMMVKESTLNGEECRIGQLNLVDLAGSECVGRSGQAAGKGKREAGNINQSLLTLGRVIDGLLDNAVNHIPYRDSKLTRLLQESLGGRAKTCILATLSPADDSSEESLSTLNYAFKARNIKNKPVSNSVASKRTVLKEYNMEIEDLRFQLQAQRDKSGTFLPTDKYQEMLNEMEASKASLEASEEQLGVLRCEVDTQKCRADGLAGDLGLSKKMCLKAQSELDHTAAQLVITKTELDHTSVELGATAAVVGEQAATETCLTSEAHELQQSLFESERDLQGLLAKVQRSGSLADSKVREASEFGGQALASTANLSDSAQQLVAVVEVSGVEVELLLSASLQTTTSHLQALSQLSSTHDEALQARAEEHGDAVVLGCRGLASEAERVLGVEGEVSRRCVLQAATVERSAQEVATQLTLVSGLVSEQRTQLLELASALGVRAKESEAGTRAFVDSHCAALEEANQANARATQELVQALAEQQASMRSFSASHSSELQSLSVELEAARAQLLEASLEQLEQERTRANALAVEQEAKASELGSSFASQADDLAALFAERLGALKTSHCALLTSTSSKLSAEARAGAQKHGEAMGLVLEKGAEAASAVEKTRTAALTDSVNAFEVSSVAQLNSVSELSSKAHLEIETAAAALSSNATEFGEQLVQQTHAQSEAFSESSSRVDALALRVQAASALLSKTHAAHATEFEGSHLELTSAVLGPGLAALKEKAEAVEASSKMFVGSADTAGGEGSGVVVSVVAELCKARAESVEALALLAQSEAESANQALGALVGTVGDQAGESCPSKLLSQVKALVEGPHLSALTSVEAQVRAHVLLAEAPLEATGGTPTKRSFPQPETLTKTRPVAAIMKEHRTACSKSVADSTAAAAVAAIMKDVEEEMGGEEEEEGGGAASADPACKRVCLEERGEEDGGNGGAEAPVSGKKTPLKSKAAASSCLSTTGKNGRKRGESTTAAASAEKGKPKTAEKAGGAQHRLGISKRGSALASSKAAKRPAASTTTATSEGGEENEDTGSNKKAATASHKSAPSSSPTGAVVATKNPLMEVVNFGEEEGP